MTRAQEIEEAARASVEKDLPRDGCDCPPCERRRALAAALSLPPDAPGPASEDEAQRLGEEIVVLAGERMELRRVLGNGVALVQKSDPFMRDELDEWADEARALLSGKDRA